jgi:serine/threonine protein kinase
MEHLTVSQKRSLYELCWKFEEAWVSDRQTCPTDWVSKIDGIDSKYVLSELEETLHELKSHLQENPTASSSDRYDFQEEIARGGTGVIWRVWDRHLRRPSAIKYLLDSSDNREMRARLRREARICARLTHPGIVPIHELGSFADGRPFVCMKLIDGKTLLELLKSTPPPPMEKLIEFFTNACHAVAFAHSQNIIHRDLTPSNIMVGQFGEVQIMDWGLAKDLSNKTLDEDGETIASQFGGPTLSQVPINKNGSTVSLESERTRQGVVFGTISYLSPEQASGHVDQIDKRSDVFALGAILCRILTGYPPYTEPNQESLLSLAQSGMLQPALERLLRSPHRALARLAIRCMTSERDSRPIDANSILEELDRIRTTDKRRRVVLPFSVGAVIVALSVFALMNRTASELETTAGTSDPQNTSGTSARSENIVVTDPKVIQSLIAAGETDIVLRSYRDALDKHPDDIMLHSSICVALLNRQRYAEAETLAKKLVQMDPSRTGHFYYLGESQYFQGRFAEALENAREAKLRLVKDPQPKMPVNDRILVYQRSIDLLERISSSPNPPACDSSEFEVMAKVCELTQRVEWAIYYFEKSLASESDQLKRSMHRFNLIVTVAPRFLEQENLTPELCSLICEAVLDWLNQQYYFALYGSDERRAPPEETQKVQMYVDAMQQLKTDLQSGITRGVIDNALANPRIEAKHKAALEEFKAKVDLLK